MKKLWMVVLLLGLLQTGYGQAAKQRRYLLEQLAALKVYAGYLEKGYGIVKDGLGVVEGFKRGDFDLHRVFFTSLGMVSPKVKQYVKVGAILSMQVKIAKKSSACMQQLKASGQLTVQEVDYLQAVFNRLLDGCMQSLDELSDVVSNGRMELKDDERIKRIDVIYAGMLEKQSFVQGFSNHALALVMQRKHEGMDVGISKKLNGLP